MAASTYGGVLAFSCRRSAFCHDATQQTYAGHSTVIKRLKRIQSLADLFFVLAGLSMVDTVFQFFRPLFTDYFSYYTYVYNKWVVLLLIAAALELYTVHRIGTELKHEESVSDEQP